MSDSELEKFIDLLKKEIFSGLRHGFFDFQIASEVIKGKKRRIRFKAGKTYIYIINEDEILN